MCAGRSAGRQVGTSIGHSYVLALMIGVEAAECNGLEL